MTKTQYLDMCEQLGTEPREEEIPVEFEDFPYEVQQAFELYSLLPVRIAEFSGTYLGRDLSQLGFYFDLYDVAKNERLFFLRLITMIDSLETNHTNEKAAQNKSSKKGKT